MAMAILAIVEGGPLMASDLQSEIGSSHAVSFGFAPRTDFSFG